ncbi:MAG TPA: hypothetical protein VF528_12555 [Pyrinomonadaceae bacterium]
MPDSLRFGNLLQQATGSLPEQPKKYRFSNLRIRPFRLLLKG